MAGFGTVPPSAWQRAWLLLSGSGGLGFCDSRRLLSGAAFLAESAFFAMVFLAFVAFAGFLAAILRSSGHCPKSVYADADLKREGAIIQTALRRYRTRKSGSPTRPPTSTVACFTYTTAAQEPFLHISI